MILQATQETCLPPAQRYGLALTGILSSLNRYRLDTLYPKEPTHENNEGFKLLLERDWSIRSAEDLLGRLTALSEGGGDNEDFLQRLRFIEVMDTPARERFIASTRTDHKQYARWTIVNRSLFRLKNKGIASWDAGRYVMLCRWGAALNFISDAQAWDLIMSMATSIQAIFEDWYEYGLSYITGYCFCFADISTNESNLLMADVKKLLSGEGSPWALNWSTDLSGEFTG